VWLVLSDKQGDNAQVEAIAKILPWPTERITVLMRDQWVYGKPKVEPTLHHIDPDRSDPLRPPWPDLILTVGRRPSMVALWVKAQSGGHTRIVLVGKPSGMTEHFDLVIFSAENQLAPLPNVLAIRLPLMEPPADAVAAAAAEWRARLQELPRPLVGILVGGATGPFIFNSAVVDRLVDEAHRVIDQGGTPYLTTSRRTAPEVVEALRDGLPAAARLFCWAPDVSDNPYRALLGLADAFVVTGDSISMMVEVVRVGKPLAILPLPTSRLGAVDQLRRSLTRWMFAPVAEEGPVPLRHRVSRALFRMGVVTHTRDFNAFYQMLIENGLAVMAGQSFRRSETSLPNDMPQILERIERLI
jgi:mitochondrial fission protein ELM1